MTVIFLRIRITHRHLKSLKQAPLRKTLIYNEYSGNAHTYTHINRISIINIYCVRRYCTYSHGFIFQCWLREEGGRCVHPGRLPGAGEQAPRARHSVRAGVGSSNEDLEPAIPGGEMRGPARENPRVSQQPDGLHQQELRIQVERDDSLTACSLIIHTHTHMHALIAGLSRLTSLCRGAVRGSTSNTSSAKY